jgi:AmmeMemoRadiSam system protein B
MREMRFGNFYPGDLRRQIAEFLVPYSPAPVPAGPLLAAAVPHAGWRFSGGVAARALKALSERSRPAGILLLGAVHRARLERAALSPDDAWETPLGPVAVDAALAAEAQAALGDLAVADAAAHDTEHSLEVVLPFIREVFPGVPVVPIMVPPEGSPAEVGRRLARLASTRDVVAVASTDLTHYGEGYGFTPAGLGDRAHDWMRGNDARILDLARRLEAEAIPGEARRSWNACGPGALAAAAAFARELGAREGTVLERTDSHEVVEKGEPFTMAVGYAGIVFG